MYILVIKRPSGKVIVHACRTMRIAKSLTGHHWRIKDHTGWCDGSLDAYKHIPVIPDHPDLLIVEF